jgi:tryptophan synthase alpha chain
VLIVDYPPEESGRGSRPRGLGIDPDLPALAHVHRRAHRARGQVARGYIYYVSLKGVTGAANIDTQTSRR